MHFSDWKIGARMAAGYAVVLVLLIGVAGLGVFAMQRSNAALHHIVDVNGQKINLLDDMSKSVHIVSRVIRSIALMSDEERAKKEHLKIDAARARYNEAFSKLEKMPLDPTGQTLVAKIAKERDNARKLNDKFALLVKTDKEAAVAMLLGEAGPATEQWQADIQHFIDLQESKSRDDEEAAEATYHRALTLMLVLSGIAVLFGVVVAVVITRSITVPMQEAVHIAQTVASGDLTSQIEVRTKDETGQLLQSLKEMNDSLIRIVGQVRTSTDTMANASGQIASGNLDLSARTEQQAGSLEETASSMEELTGNVKLNSDNARQANTLAMTASEVAEKGGAVVSQVVETMGSINNSSKKIVDIISVIDGIAFQTNILALNAAVEAARAGEQGRGFAVVAGEVRNLAQRSASAAKEIKELIGDSVEKVEAGARLVDQAGSTMQDVVASIARVAHIMADITSASQEQTQGIEQINQAITQMDEVTQQNAALVEEAAASAAQLQEEADGLAKLVGVFKLAETYRASVQAKRSARRPVASARAVALEAT